MAHFQTIRPEELGGDVFTRIGKQWMLVSAGDDQASNMMTASWGGLGVLWNKPVSTIYIRPSRYTLEFLEKEDYYALSFLPEEHRDAHKICGSRSGRDLDKAAAAGLHVCHDQKAPYYEEAELVLICRKLYVQDMTLDGFVDRDLIDKNYGSGDLHRVFVGEIETVLKR
ncbi:MAG: flavin reductase family protein [Clostridia bacterium]|nr:flavin reductase family protein [Clostridia bacterium]